MSRLLALAVGLVAVAFFAYTSPVAEAHPDHVVTVHGRIVSFDTGHHRSFLLRTRRGHIEVFVGDDTRIAVDDHIAKPSDLEVGMRAHVTGFIAITDNVHHAIRARIVRAFTPPDHDGGHD